MKCICSYCGHKAESSQLGFDLKNELAEAGQDMGKEKGRIFITLCNLMSKMSEGPSFITEKRLKDNLITDPENPYDRDKKLSWLCITNDEFCERVNQVLKKLENFPVGNKTTPDEIMSYARLYKRKLERETVRTPLIELCEKLTNKNEADAVAAFLSGDLALPDKIVDLKLRLIKGEGDIAVSEVRTRGNSLISRERLCPYCGRKMSYLSGAYPEIVLTVLGGPRVSKSTTLTACASQFIDNGSINTIPVKWEGWPDDEDWKIFQSKCLEPYQRNQKVEPTQKGSPDAIPRFTVKVHLGERKRRTYLLTVVDFPGELMNENGIDEEVKRKYDDLYQNVDCIWYCTDGAELLEIDSSEELKRYGYEDKTPASIDRICSNLRELSMFLGDKIPVACIVGKSDLMAPQFAPEYKLYSKYGDDICYYARNGSYPVIDGKKIFDYMQGIRQIVHESSERLDEAIRTAFPNHAYIALSGYGHTFPTQPGENLAAYNVMMPFMWMLAVKGLIEVREVKNNRRERTINHYNALEDEITKRNLCLIGQAGYETHY